MKQTNRTEQTPKKKGGWLPIVITVLVIVFLGFCCHIKKNRLELEKKAAQKNEAPAINVVTMDMEPRSIRDRISFPGSFTESVNLVVSTEVSGMILKKIVREGDWITAGDDLALIDASKYQNAFHAAEASYDAALASKNRLDQLYRSNLANKSDLDAVTAEMKNHLAAMRVAAIDLEKSRIKAPVSGLVNRIFIEEGQFMDTGNPVLELIQTDPIKLKVGIPESDVTAVRSLDTFDVRVDALGGSVYKARKNHLTRTTDSLARAYSLELIIDNPGGELLPDMFGRVDIVKKTVENALALPLYAVVSIDDRQLVYLAAKHPKHAILEAALSALGLPGEAPVDTAISREVKTGIQDGWMVEITQGLDAGDRVITVGQRSVSDGQKIHIIRTQGDQEDLLR